MKTPYKYASLKEAFNQVDHQQPVFADTETCVLYGKIRLLQLMQEGWEEAILVEWPEPYTLAAKLGECYSIWHNAHYDITTVQAQTETRWAPARFDDTFLLARLAFFDKEKFSLDDVLSYCLGYDPYERQKLDKKRLQKTNWDVHKLSEEQELYAATDVYYMPEVWANVSRELKAPSYRLDRSTLVRCLDFQWNGMHVDKHRMFERYEQNQEKIDEIDIPINVNSWQQVRPYIGEEQSDDLALATFELAGNERAKNVRTVRKLRKQLSFLDKFDTADDFIYGKFLPSARSGRLTSKDQNLQQLPRALKGIFGYQPHEGRVYIYADYAQLELRTICAITMCKTMEALFREEKDLHSYTAEMLFGPDYEKRHRQISKTCNFSLLYGGGVPMFLSILIKTAMILMDESEGNQIRKRWRNLWREIYAWQEKGISQWRKGRPGSTPLGRRYKAKMMTDQLNIENQGAGAEVAKLALHYFGPELDEYEDAFLANFIHDSFIVDCPDDPAIYQPLAVKMAESMQEAWFEMSKLFGIKDLPMPVDVKVGYNWGDIEDDDIEDLWEYTLEPYKMLEKVNA